jgi:major type 1 subunit fimbrin (pilin)
MNKNLVAVAMLAASAFTANVFAEDGQINFTGSIIPNPCTVTSDTKNQTIDMGKIGVTSFPIAGARSRAQTFSLQLTNCPDTITSAKVNFGGAPIDNDPAILALTNEPGVATGVGIQISDRTDTPVKMRDLSGSYPLASGTAVNTLSFTARYISTVANVTSGSANAVTDFTIVYP